MTFIGRSDIPSRLSVSMDIDGATLHFEQFSPSCACLLSPPHSLVFPLHIFCPQLKLIFLCPRCLVQMEHLLSLTQQAEAVTQIESCTFSRRTCSPMSVFASYLMVVAQVTKFSLMLSCLRLTPFQLGRSCEREMDSLIIRFRTRRDKRRKKDAPPAK